MNRVEAARHAHRPPVPWSRRRSLGVAIGCRRRRPVAGPGRVGVEDRRVELAGRARAPRGAAPLVVHRRVDRGRRGASSCSSAGLDGKTIDNFRIPGAQSQEALDLLDREASQSQSGSSATVVFESRGRHRRRAGRARDPARASPRSARSPDVTSVTDPYGPLSALIVSNRGPTAGQIAMVTVQFADQVQDLADRRVRADARTRPQPAAAAGVRVEFGGAVTDYADRAARRATPTSSVCSPRS